MNRLVPCHEDQQATMQATMQATPQAEVALRFCTKPKKSKQTNIVLPTRQSSGYTAHNTPSKPMLFSNNMLKFSGLFFACLLRKLSPNSQWHNKVKALILLHPDVPLLPMGFPDDWMLHIYWSGADA